MIAIAILLAPVAAAPAASAVERAIEAAMTDSAAGWNAGSVERFMRVYSDASDTSFVTATGLIRGKPAMIARYRQRYALDDPEKRGRLSFETLDFRQLDPNHALYIARYTLTFGDGKTQSGPTSLVFRKERAGWHIIADHSS